MKERLDQYLIDLLHINDCKTNKLIDLYAKDLKKTVFLKSEIAESISYHILDIIAERIGKPGNTILKNSARKAIVEQRIGNKLNVLDWSFADGINDAKILNDFVDNVYKELSSKGNNPLFLSVGALKWKLYLGDDEIKEVTSPILIFPIKLIRTGETSPLSIEFINDDVYFNPCLYSKLKNEFSSEVVAGLPHPNGDNIDFDEPVMLEKLGRGFEYFNKLSKYAESCKASNDQSALFDIEANIVAISQYNHDEICMYYDIRRNKNKILEHPLVKRMFTGVITEEKKDNDNKALELILPYDSVQEKIIKKVVNGDSVIIKGPPGTGKTLTIANMIAALMYQNKRVLFASRKISALSEVHAKLPEELRNFTLLLDYETEAQAAKISPIEIKKDLRALLEKRRNYVPKTGVLNDREHARVEKYSAINDLLGYYNFTFDKTLLSGSYYDAIDIFYKNDKLPIINFIETKDALKYDINTYNSCISLVKEIEDSYKVITDNGIHTVSDSPWYGFVNKSHIEDIYKDYNQAATHFNTAYDILKSTLGDINFENLNLRSLMWLLMGNITEEQIIKLLDMKQIDDIHSQLNDNIIAYNKIKGDSVFTDIISLNYDDLTKKYGLLLSLELDRNLDNSILTLIRNNYHLFDNDNSYFLNTDSIENIMKIFDEIKLIIDKVNLAEYEYQKVYKKELSDSDSELILKLYDTLEPFMQNPDKKLGLFSFGAKKAFERLAQLSYLDDCSFDEIVTATKKFKEANDYSKDIKAQLSLIYRQVQKQLTYDELKCIYYTLTTSKKANSDVRSFVDEINKNYDDIICCAKVAQLDKFSIGDLISKYELTISYRNILNTINQINDICGIISEGDNLNFEALAYAIVSLLDIKKLDMTLAHSDIVRIYGLLKAKDSSLLPLLNSGLEIINKRSYAFENNKYVNKQAFITFKDLKTFISEVNDRNILGAYINYKELIELNSSICDFKTFFADFESGEKNVYEYQYNEIKGEQLYRFVDIFEHSFYYSLINGKISLYAGNRNNIGQGINYSFDNYTNSENEISKCNTSIIEQVLMKTIEPNDPNFSFLGHEKDDRNLRTMFKVNPSAILKLKKCLIVSPSTVSLLFRPEDYNNFDVVIIDEASQLEPIKILPVLFRSKQCVIVGDEWQMPPISHFKMLSDKSLINEDEELKLADSALSLALKSEAFEIFELKCHYRSRTESLIKFSQEKFYPNMRTFPAPIPKKDGLGIHDIYVKNGIGSDGVNVKEANEVVNQIKLHFDKYYNAEKKILSKSFGVVAFGVKQIDYITNLITNDKDLNEKIQAALGNYDGVKEKLIFFKTIETVQGQETEHLILSLTYGLNKKGEVVQRFGQLNRDDFGKCIFNVSVTRAQSEITVIHSIEPEQITNPRIEYIAKYLYITRYFSKDGKEQFVSVKPNYGFMKNVGEYIESLGIDKNRIVFDYGVTNGSIRIPIAILSEDLSRAICGIWVEKPYPGHQYIDFNCKYYNVLVNNGWKFHNICAHNWFDNNEAEKTLLKKFINKM